jgi:hypothetical protein
MDDDNIDNIVAAILAISSHAPEVALNRYGQLQQLLAGKREAELPEGQKKLLNQVKEMRRARS